jgi:hypothetical protein
MTPRGMPTPRPTFAPVLRPFDVDFEIGVADAEPEVMDEDVGDVDICFDEDCEALADADECVDADVSVADVCLGVAVVVPVVSVVGALAVVVVACDAEAAVAVECAAVVVDEVTEVTPPPLAAEDVALFSKGSWRSKSRSSIPRKSLNWRSRVGLVAPPPVATQLGLLIVVELQE